MSKQRVKETIEIALKLTLLGVMIYWCLQILKPFIIPLIWGIIIAVAINPIYLWLNNKLGKKPRIAALFICLVMGFFILIPTALLVKSGIKEVKHISTMVKDGDINIQNSVETVSKWPLVGGFVEDLWTDINQDAKEAISGYEKQVMDVGKFLFHSIVQTSYGFLVFILAIIISGILLATPHTRATSGLLFKRVAGEFGTEFMRITEETIKNVVKGILAVAVIQAVVMGLGMLLAGVPLAGIWTLVVLFWAVVQLPTIILVVPLIIFLWMGHDIGTGWAIFWSIYFILAGAIDNVLKPIFMGQGASVPMFVIFIGAIGGMIWNGILGLFLGAIVLSLGYKLLLHWIVKSKETRSEGRFEV